MKKRILIVTQYFYPENFKSNDLAFELAARGYHVEVLTGLPNYPQGKIFEGYSFFSSRKQIVNGVTVHRAFLIPRGKGGGCRLMLNYVSWAFFASFRALFLSVFNTYDCLIVHEPSPITQGIPAIIVKKLKKIPLYFWIMDLWPESLISAGGVRNKTVISMVNTLVKWIYKHSDTLLISSQGFRDSIVSKGNFAHKIVYFPNWGEDVFVSETETMNPSLPQGFKIMFAGNIGEAQDFHAILQAALLLKGHDVRWIIVGDGRKKQWVEDFIQSNQLQEKVFLMGKYPIEAMPSFFQKADVMLVSLKDELVFNLTVPAKIQAYMAASKPIIAMLNGEGQEILKQAQCGYTVNAGDYQALAKLVEEISKIPKESLQLVGRNGFEYYKANFTKQHCIDNLCKLMDGK